MATKVLIIGNSGTGKSTAMRNLPPDKTGIIRVVKKRLPFKESGFKIIDSDGYDRIKSVLRKATSPIIVIDDVQYLLANEFMGKATEKGYEKFTILAKNFWELLNAIDELSDDKTVYLLSHLEKDGDREKIKTIGKMLDEKITIEGLFTIVLKTEVKNGMPENEKYFFSTKNNGNDTVKSPFGLFDSDLIPNDLAMIDRRIREFYEIPYPTDTNSVNKTHKPQPSA
jgi:predicted ATP-dependent serine protease